MFYMVHIGPKEALRRAQREAQTKSDPAEKPDIPPISPTIAPRKAGRPKLGAGFDRPAYMRAYMKAWRARNQQE